MMSITMEERRLPYVVRPVNIGIGGQFAPSFPGNASNYRVPAILDRRVQGKTGFEFRVGGTPFSIPAGRRIAMSVA